ncbi:xanthine dehydrogenase accessory protein XdhC [Sphingomonas sp.]|uniref:xanthine dehydrogenase accessory protein XdhC n=1 Tax=Sphingomonas sp. TaxID=28214 RepID=UPI000DB63C2B|nr:xanthine dehydrogenase accessory protein XdhC [Sphingomonas sp.]PZU11685.1 MAG: xanthine dehydrogenase accessory protein XdhC [Sphingomonas sp.]
MTELLRTHATARITVLATEGSAPRGAGTAMTVTVDSVEGTIGGGNLEYRAIEQARLLLAYPDGAWRVQDYPLGPLLGQCCGGRVRLLIERMDGPLPEGDVLVFGQDRVRREPGDAPLPAARGARPQQGERWLSPSDMPRTPLMLFGAGHVGRAVARVLEGLPYLVGWYDTRPDYADTPGVTLCAETDIEQCVAELQGHGAILIMTHDHALDYRLARSALAGTARYIGLIGSRTKRARFVSRLEAEGLDVTRLVCPVGLPGIAGKEPAVIATAIAAQLLLECAP